MCDGKAACRPYAAGTRAWRRPALVRRHPAGPLQRRRRRAWPAPSSRAIPIPAGPPARAARRAPATPTATARTFHGTICSKNVNGVDCATGGECQSGACQQGVCCAGPCTGNCKSCALPGSRGACTPIPAGKSARPVRRPGVVELRHRRPCNGAGACRLYPPGPRVRQQSVHRIDGDAGGRCDGTGTCVAGRAQPVRPTSAAGRAAGRVRHDRRLHERQRVHGDQLRKQPLGGLRAGSECTAALRAGRLLPEACTAPACRARSPAPAGHARPSPPDRIR